MIVRGIDVGYVLRQTPREDFFDEKMGIFSQLARSTEGTFMTPPVTLEVRSRDYFREVRFWRGIIRSTAHDFSSPGVFELCNKGRQEQEEREEQRNTLNHFLANVMHGFAELQPAKPFRGKWQERTHPFVLSFAPVAVTPPTRIQETRNFVEYLGKYLPDFQAPLCVALNIFHCMTANGGNGKKKMPGELSQEIGDLLTCFENLAIPVLVQIDPLFSLVVAKAISKHPMCHGFVVSNPIPWRMFPDYLALEKRLSFLKSWVRGITVPPGGAGIIDRLSIKRGFVLLVRFLFGRPSLLEKTGSGAVAGKAITPLVEGWLRNASEIRKPIVAGGCFSRADVKAMFDLGASAILLDGAVALLRPWRMRSLARYANTYGASRERSLGKRIVVRLTHAIERDSPARHA